MRKTIPLLAAVLVEACSFLPIHSGRAEYPVSDLRVRDSTGAVYRGSETDAINRMMDEAVRSSEEDMWLAVYNRDGTTYFVDVEQKAGKNEYSISISPDEKLLHETLSALPAGTKVRIYHIHPFSEEDDSKYLESGVDVPVEPSMFDFISQLIRLPRFRKINDSLENLPDRVVGVAGYAEYSADENQFVPSEVKYWEDKMSADDYQEQMSWSILEGVNNAYNSAEATRLFTGMRKPDEIFDTFLKHLNSTGLKTEYKRLRETPESLKIKRKGRNLNGGR